MFKKKKGKNSNQKVKAGHIKNQKPKKKGKLENIF